MPDALQARPSSAPCSEVRGVLETQVACSNSVPAAVLPAVVADSAAAAAVEVHADAVESAVVGAAAAAVQHDAAAQYADAAARV
eukprot:4547317-Amphidinium_carterae.1